MTICFHRQCYRYYCCCTVALLHIPILVYSIWCTSVARMSLSSRLNSKSLEFVLVQSNFTVLSVFCNSVTRYMYWKYHGQHEIYWKIPTDNSLFILALHTFVCTINFYYKYFHECGSFSIRQMMTATTIDNISSFHLI